MRKWLLIVIAVLLVGCGAIPPQYLSPVDWVDMAVRSQIVQEVEREGLDVQVGAVFTTSIPSGQEVMFTGNGDRATAERLQQISAEASWELVGFRAILSGTPYIWSSLDGWSK